MANIAPATQPTEGTQLTKPADWSLYMVTAALKFSSDNTSQAISYTTADSGRLDILKTLNWYEAHDEYAWPDFSSMGFDFSQAMRFRRALVSDVFVALQKAGHVRVMGELGEGGLGTPESVRGRGVKRGGAVAGGGRRLAERKRRCQLGDGSDTEAASDNEMKPVWDDEDEFLRRTMVTLMIRCNVDLEYLEKEKDIRELADTVHDCLVEVWEGPMRPSGEFSGTLIRKAAIWARDKQSTAERSTPKLDARDVPTGH